MELKSYLKDIFEQSLLLHDDYLHSLIIPHTLFTHISTSAQELIVVGRLAWEEEQPTVTLRHLIKKHETLPETIAKYVAKTLLRAHIRIKKELGHEIIIFPENVVFNEKCNTVLI
jgi:hypothetical protein